MNKHLKNFLIVFAIIAVVVTPFFVYIEINKERLIFDYMLYDNIQFNGNNYCRAENQSYLPSNEGEERGPVYLVKASRVYYKNSYTAYVNTGYEGEEEEIYLFFDSATWIRDGYETVKTVERDD